MREADDLDSKGQNSLAKQFREAARIKSNERCGRHPIAHRMPSRERRLAQQAQAFNFLVETAKSIAPISGEIQDLRVLTDNASKGWEKCLAGASLAASPFSATLLPNAGSFLRSCDNVTGAVPRAPLRSADEIYGGVRQASKFLQDAGVPRADRLKYLQAFEEGTITFRKAGPSEFGLRYYDDINYPGGPWLFESFPASRQSLAIKPEWSSMSGFRQFQIRPGTPIIQGRAAAQGPYLPGGQTQKFILNWKTGLIEP